mmetsp:Transcript_28680/g.58627  ORF Transcript_28680/g.58627 Transcript_28680/m.58627 type:complete len:344 (+) Transcript_28680:24-1055(+)
MHMLRGFVVTLAVLAASTFRTQGTPLLGPLVDVDAVKVGQGLQVPESVSMLVGNLMAVYDLHRMSLNSSSARETEVLCAAFPTIVVAVRPPAIWIKRLARLLREFGLCQAYLVDRRCIPSCRSTDDMAALVFASNTTMGIDLNKDSQTNNTRKLRAGKHMSIARQLDATGAHLFAMAALRSLRLPFALILEEDVDFRVAPSSLHALAHVISKQAHFDFSMLGGCRNLHVNSTLVSSDLPGGGDLYESLRGSIFGSRCTHSYIVSSKGAGSVLFDATTSQVRQNIDIHLNSVHARTPQLSCTFVEPPVSCQVRGHTRKQTACGANGPFRSENWTVPFPNSSRFG